MQISPLNMVNFKINKVKFCKNENLTSPIKELKPIKQDEKTVTLTKEQWQGVNNILKNQSKLSIVCNSLDDELPKTIENILTISDKNENLPAEIPEIQIHISDDEIDEIRTKLSILNNDLFFSDKNSDVKYARNLVNALGDRASKVF